MNDGLVCDAQRHRLAAAAVPGTILPSRLFRIPSSLPEQPPSLETRIEASAFCLSVAEVLYYYLYYHLLLHKGSIKHSHIRRRKIYTGLYRQACRVKIIKFHQNHVSKRCGIILEYRIFSRII